MVFNAFQLFTQYFFHNPEILAQDCFCQFFGEPVEFAFLFHLDINHLRMNSQGNVGRQGPGGGGPDQEVFLGVLALESHHHGVGFNLLIALGHLMGGEAGAATGAIGQNFMALIHVALLKELVQQPPHRLDIVVIQGDIRVFQIQQVAHFSGHIPPGLLIGKDRGPAFLVKFGDSVAFDILLAAEFELFFHLNFHGQAVGVPAGLALDLVALHSLKPADRVFEGAGNDMVNPRPAVGRGGAFIKDKRLVIGPADHAFSQEVNAVPVTGYGLFPLGNRRFGQLHKFFHLQSPSLPGIILGQIKSPELLLRDDCGAVPPCLQARKCLSLKSI